MKQVNLKQQAVKKLKNGYPLVKEQDLAISITQSEENQLVQFCSNKNEIIGTGYLSAQNKGIGWVFNAPKFKWTKHDLASLFQSAFQKRSAYFHDEGTTAFRLFNGEGDGLGGVTIDFYAGFLVVSWYNQFVYQEKAQLLAAIGLTDLEVEGIYEKIRFPHDTKLATEHVCGKEAPEPLVIYENGVAFATYLNEGWMTGIFLDQKEVRGKLVNGFLAGKTLLNTFSYTGAFSVAAAMGGALATTSVDLAKRSLEKTKEQFSVNQLPLDNHDIIVMDVFNYFRYARKKDKSFDCVLLDPPSFARSKKHTFSVAKNYGELVGEVEPLIARNGYLIASTNAANVSESKFKKMIEEALKSKQRVYRLVEHFQLPADFKVASSFPEGNYLKVFLYKLDD